VSDVTRDGLAGGRPGREATVGVSPGRRGEQPMVPRATFTSYYGRPVINQPVWQAPDIPGYLFLGGLAGASSVVAACADATGRPGLARGSKMGAVGAISLGALALIHDLGRPARFANMLRTFKVTSPMSVGSWLLSGYGPATAVAAGSSVTGWFPRLGRSATVFAAATGPLVAAYTAALLSDTAVPAWHGGYRELPFVFVGSGATAAAGLGLVTAPTAEAGPVRWLAAFAGGLELAAARRMEQRLGPVGSPYHEGKSGRYMRASQALTGLGVVTGLLLGRRSRIAATAAGAALLAASAAGRWGVFEAGITSANTPEHTIGPQRERLVARSS
jgi:hypothetical protein